MNKTLLKTTHNKNYNKKGLQGVTAGCRELKGVTRGYKGL